MQCFDQLEVPHMAHNLASELSGGQSKLVDIGRSMMGDPQLLLLDEPVAGVAGPLAMKIFSNLRNIVSETGISVLIIEHNMDFILRQGVDRIVVMNEGEILMVGTQMKFVRIETSLRRISVLMVMTEVETNDTSS